MSEWRFKPVELISVNSHEEAASLLLRGYVIEPVDCGNRDYSEQVNKLLGERS